MSYIYRQNEKIIIQRCKNKERRKKINEKIKLVQNIYSQYV